MEKTKIIQKYTTVIQAGGNIYPVDESKLLQGKGVYEGLNFTYHDSPTKEEYIETLKQVHNFLYNKELDIDLSMIEVLPVTIKIEII